MTMVFERVHTQGIAEMSYLVGDDSTGTAAVIDPRPDVDIYLDIARRYKVAITHVIETHIHADFMSGARELVDRVGGAELCASGEEDASYDFEVRKIHAGDQFEFGSVLLTVRHTPGHTPEHISLEIAEKDRPKSPWGVFSGDSLFVGSAGRPDLLGDDQTEELVEKLFHTLRDYYLKLDDSVIVYPCHGAGSACGADIGERPMTTVGYERNTNEFLQYDDLESFRKFVQKGAPPVPHHYPKLKKINAGGPTILGHAPTIPGLPPKEFQEAIKQDGIQLVDTREMLAFGGGHIPGAINIGNRPELSVWAGDMLSHDQPIYLVVDDETQLNKILWEFVYTGFTKFGGYLVGGMKTWETSGLPLVTTPQMTVHDLNENRDEVQILDVRPSSDYEKGHIPGAKNYYVADMREWEHAQRSNGNGSGNGDAEPVPVDTKKPVAVYCGSGYRASLAASLLQRNGFQDVRNVPGSWQAWQKSDYAKASDDE